MNKAVLLGATAALAACVTLAAGYAAGNAPARPAAPAATEVLAATAVPVKDTLDRAEVEAIVRDYLLKNPEVLLEVQYALEAKQKEAQRVAHLDVIKTQKDDIFNSAYDGIVGNPAGKVTIVEFYDYNCGFCKRAMEDMQELVKADPELRFVLKEFPILSPDSHKASVVSMAFHKLMPDKYGAFHTALLGGEGRATEAKAIKVALSLGADQAKLREHMQDPDIPAALEKTYDLANKLAITGTPSYVVGDEVVFGALGQKVLAEKIEAAKASL